MKEKLAAGKAKVLKRGSSGTASRSKGDSFSSPVKKHVSDAKKADEDPASPTADPGTVDGGTPTPVFSASLNGKAKQRFRDMCLLQQANDKKTSKSSKKGGGGGAKPPNELKLPGFASLIKELLKERGGASEALSDSDVKAAFEIADKNKSGTIDEGEFATLFQLILQGNMKGLSNTSVFFGPSTKLKELREAAEVKYQALEEARTKPNAFGLVVGKSASKDFFPFSECFEPLCAETPEAAALRVEGFKDADPNGNGLCSLAELETFVLKRLVSKYPKTGKGHDVSSNQ
jgi:hypothetical protein